MNRQVVVRGALAGMVGGIVMTMWSMMALWLTGSGSSLTLSPIPFGVTPRWMGNSASPRHWPVWSSTR